jgi:hypothetical protein
MAVLDRDNNLEFESVAEFLGHYDSHISKGGFYLDAEGDWPLRQQQSFTIVIVGEPRRAAVQAEVVFCGGGKVGLQLAADPAQQRAVDGLVRALRSDAESAGGARGPLAMPQLKDDGTVLYDSAADFIGDYEANIQSGAMYVQSPRPWPKGKTLAFMIRVRGEDDLDMPLQAKVLVADQGLVGLEPVLDEAARAGLAGLVEVAREIAAEEPEEQDEAAAEPPAAGPGAAAAQAAGAAAPAADGDKPVSRGLVYATRDAAEFGPLELFDIRPDVKPQTTLVGLVASVVAARRPLRLELVSNQISLAFRFKADGSLVDFTGPSSEADLLKRLVKADFLDKQQAAELEAELTPAQTAVEMLSERKLVNRQQLMIAVGQQAIDAFESVRAAGEVPFRAFAEKDVYEDGLPFGAFAARWLEESLRKLEADQVKALLKPMWKRALLPRPDSRWPLAEMSLDAAGRRFADKLDGAKPLPAQVAAFDKGQRDKLFRLAVALRCLRAVDLVRPAASDPKNRERLEELRREVAAAEKGSRFDQAGVHWSAHWDMYGPAMQQLQRKYGRGSPLSRLGDEAAGLCRQRIEMAKLANEVLADAHTRQQYRRELIAPALLEESAQIIFRKGQAQIGDDNPRGALPLLEMAVELDPDKLEYRDQLQRLKQHLKKTGRG